MLNLMPTRQFGPSLTKVSPLVAMLVFLIMATVILDALG